jgi:tetratricopeptide (TPR) repeat protein
LAYAIEPQSWQAAGGGARPVRGASADRFLQLLLEEALAAALEAEARGASGWRVDAAVALASHYLGDRATAGLRAERAVAALPVGVTDWNAMAVLALFADERQQAIRTAIRAREEWPREWMSDVHSAYTVLGAHPEGTAELAVAHFDFLLWMGAFERAGEVLGAALARFPTAAPVHDRWRGQELRRGGAPRLEQSYRELLAGEHPPAVAAELSWYAGYASLVAAEFHRRRTELDLAHASYERALAAFAACVEQAPALEQTSAHYQAMARAGQARLFLDQGQWEQATAHLVAAIEWHPAAADALDGLNQSMVATATTLRAQLVAAELVDQVARIDAALALLTPEQLLPAPYDRVGPPTRTADGRRPLGEEPPR